MTLFLRIEEGGHEEKCLYALIQKVKDPETGLFQSFCSLRQLCCFFGVCLYARPFFCMSAHPTVSRLALCLFS